jgi:hypothetical protein
VLGVTPDGTTRPESLAQMRGRVVGNMMDRPWRPSERHPTPRAVSAWAAWVGFARGRSRSSRTRREGAGPDGGGGGGPTGRSPSASSGRAVWPAWFAGTTGPRRQGRASSGVLWQECARSGGHRWRRRPLRHPVARSATRPGRVGEPDVRHVRRGAWDWLILFSENLARQMRQVFTFCVRRRAVPAADIRHFAG